MTIDDDKRLAAQAAVAEVRDGMVVGLGTGSTAAFAIAALAARIADGLHIQAVATSEASAHAAFAAGIVVRDFADFATLDLAIDGADEVDARLWAIKGAGGAMLREKAVAAAARRMIVIADGSKHVAAIGAAKLPVEVLPFARAFVVAQLEILGATVTVRPDYETDNGNLVADCRFAAMPDPRALAAAIDAIPGALGHGLFLDEVDAAYIASRGVVTRLKRP
ncbi:ribose-5-phosphate isomerase RpiA [Sphingomonas radiodurans]|uniref:ribose-5-phosphate isomerase RpiA n=1 Tax=Sphingomonas radiodurans TaxID=2890321 RepID=UPI001E499DFF|nr:ribose-5-phosphate isomerase RpiA [Sphingomonas radiodurans]WBH15950.1 ribose-5-phosphate isomerase RpiA [Sphingomonas radiodurans]